ncbi:hypothetical protein FS749_011739 [Ceratobasidium sp. UAMH 11750]|nr:hypothetical protein FS749_011739 [Ceratobasidium sp. UAMH 11750]
MTRITQVNDFEYHFVQYEQRRMSRYASNEAGAPLRLECCDRSVYITEKSQIEATIRNYYHIIFALVRGTESRRGLPLELVTDIYRYAGFISPHLNQSLSDHLQCKRFQPLSFPAWIRNHGGPITMKMVLMSRQISAQALRALGQVEIVAKRSRNPRPRVAERGHWDNFFIKIHRQADSSSNPEFGEDSSEMTWPCFETAPKGNSGQRRAIIDQSHEIWDYFQPGDRIEVVQNDYVWNIPEQGYEAVVRVRDLWEPSSNMLSFA